MTQLPEFRLESHLSRWEFNARFHLTASDVQTMTMRRLLELADEQAGVLLLPASAYRSELTPTPTDRFRIGVGRIDPEPALEAFADWLDGR